jgi:hypothetical protein
MKLKDIILSELSQDQKKKKKKAKGFLSYVGNRSHLTNLIVDTFMH